MYPVSGQVLAQISSVTSTSTLATHQGEWQTLQIVHTPSSDVSNVKLQFLAYNSSAEFYVDAVSISETCADLAVNGDMELDSNWSSIGTPTNMQSSDQIDQGSYSRYVYTTIAADGIESDTWNLRANTTYVVLARVYRISGAVQMKISSTSAEATATGIPSGWETLRIVYTPTSALPNIKLQFLATGGAAEFYVDSIHILESGEVLHWQDFHYNAQGRTIEETVVNPTDAAIGHQITRTYYASGDGNGLLHTVTQKDVGGTNSVVTTYTYDSVGRVIQTQQSSMFGSCSISYTVYDDAGNVVASICNYENNGDAPKDADDAAALYDIADPDKNRVTTYKYDTLGRRVQTTINAGIGANAIYARTGLTFYDALNRVVRTIANYEEQGTSTPGDWVWRAVLEDDVLVWRWRLSLTDDTPVSYGTDNTLNSIVDTAYNERGLLKSQRDPLGNVNFFGYDDADRLVKTIQNAGTPDYDNSYTNGDPDLSDYTANDIPDQDIITTQLYDPAGNLVKATDTLGNTNFTVYDALNRPVKTVRSASNPTYDILSNLLLDSYVAVPDADKDLVETTEYDALGRVVRTMDSLGNVDLYGYDPLGRQVKVIRSASDPAYDLATDPDLSGYSPSTDTDLDVITVTTYDPIGRVLYTEDILGRRAWSAYDGLGRQIKTICNAVGMATDDSVNDPRSSSYVPSTHSDQDLISITHYDSNGRVQWAQDKLGRKTWYVYDEQGRQVKVITNCTYISGTPAPEDSGYVGSSNPDDDRITKTLYDNQGRVLTTIDPAGLETRYIYDTLGRRVRTISNYVVQGTSDPDEWLWEDTNQRWEDGANNAIDQGTTFDQNLISESSYDRAGRVMFTRDTRGTKTTFTYDSAGRRLTVTQAAETPLATTSYTCYDKAGKILRTISNYVPLLDENDEEISLDAVDAQSEWLFNPATHGQYNDQNLITVYQYDRLGRQVGVTDPLGNQSKTRYLKNGQPKLTIDPETIANSLWL